jgi:hypothetical protein
MRQVDLALATIEEGPGNDILEWREPAEDTSNDGWHAFGGRGESRLPRVLEQTRGRLVAPLSGAGASMNGGGTSFSPSLATPTQVSAVTNRRQATRGRLERIDTLGRSRDLAIPAGCKPVERRLTAALLGSIPSPVSTPPAIRRVRSPLHRR